MKSWQKGAIVGFIWATVPIVLALLELDKILEYGLLRYVGYLFFIPSYIAIMLGFHFILVFIGAPIVGTTLGAIMGHLYDRWIEK